MPCMASDSEEYRSFNANSFYKNLPAAWDETRYLDGTVGGWISMARRSGDTWYAASISNAAKTDLTMKLDFLSKGKTYTATIYNDKRNHNDCYIRGYFELQTFKTGRLCGEV